MNKLLLLLMSVLLMGQKIDAKEYLKLENENIKVIFDSKGSLVQLTNKQTQWNIVNREPLGQSFEMLVPLEQRRFHNILGKEQKNPEVEATADKIIFTWSNLSSRYVDNPLSITFRGSVTLTPSGLVYEGEIINNSNYTVEYVGWPYFGEVASPDKTKKLICQDRNGTRELCPKFQNRGGYWGVDYPTQLCVLPESTFSLIRNDNQGLYIYSDQDSPTEMVINSFELIPGYETNLNPASDMMDGQMVRVQFKANHVVYTLPNSSYTLKPVILEPYKGSWYTGADIYRNSINRAVKPNRQAADFVIQKITISNAEDLVNYAKTAIACGVSCLHITGGWRNEAIGKSIKNLASAIETCNKLGVKVFLEMNFSKISDYSSDISKELSANCFVTDPFGLPYDRKVLCPLHETVKEAALRYAADSALICADGVVINDNNHASKSYFCFNKAHKHKVPSLTTEGSMLIDKLFVAELKRRNPQVVVLGYGFEDCQNSLYDGYQISPAAKATSLHRYINPQTLITSVVDVRSIRRDINLCLRLQYNITVDLQFYNKNLSAYPNVVSYLRQVNEFRQAWSDYLFDGTFMDTQGAKVDGNNLSYALFIAKNGKKAVLIVNENQINSVVANVSIEDSTNNLIQSSPESPNHTVCSGKVEITPMSVVIVAQE